MGTNLTKEDSLDPEGSPYGFVECEARKKKRQEERLKGIETDRVDIGRAAFESFINEMSGILFTVEEEEEELAVEDMNPDQLR